MYVFEYFIYHLRPFGLVSDSQSLPKIISSKDYQAITKSNRNSREEVDSQSEFDQTAKKLP